MTGEGRGADIGEIGRITYYELTACVILVRDDMYTSTSWRSLRLLDDPFFGDNL